MIPTLTVTDTAITPTDLTERVTIATNGVMLLKHRMERWQTWVHFIAKGLIGEEVLLSQKRELFHTAKALEQYDAQLPMSSGGKLTSAAGLQD